MEKVLNYDQIVSQLVEYCNKKQDEEITQIEATKILNQMSIKNGHQEFNYEIAVELFERVTTYNTSLTIQTLAHVIYEANDIIINKYNQAMNREMYMEEQKAYLKQIKPYCNTTILHISYVRIQEAYVQRPYIVVLIGEFIHESEIQTKKDGWFEWNLDVQIPVKSLIADLKIELLEDHNIIASLQLPCEALPMNEMKEAELQMQNVNCHTLIQLQCMLSIGNDYKELINEKMHFLDNQTQHCQEELFLLQSQLNELCKPFFRDANIQPKYTNYSNKSQLNTEIFQNIPNKNTLQPPSLQATAFRNTSSALGFKKIVIEPERQLNSYPIMARIDLLATIIAVISMMINFITPDISITYIMIIIFSIMLKHKYTLIYILILVSFGIIIEIFSLSYLDLSIFSILLIVLNILLNIGLLILTSLLLKDVGNVTILKSKLLLSL
ncbi:unnamed protein product [Paramecium pentaurelia]|uniref:Uncharacterized protein n=1 Tax=Paramecium pentaurelia TaxID=43138 RepID=A0A8S1VCH6_9CILI|nr:unnamed protein product [Paramecium pentaurelia]